MYNVKKKYTNKNLTELLGGSGKVDDCLTNSLNCKRDFNLPSPLNAQIMLASIALHI